MTKKKILFVIPIIIIGGLLIYSWILFLFTDAVPTWRHYLALLLFIVLILLFVKDSKKANLGIGLYLILCTFNLLALTPSVTTNAYGIDLGSLKLWTPNFQLLSFGLLLLFLILNFDTLINTYLDFKDKKKHDKYK
jgi:hypothetical protein